MSVTADVIGKRLIAGAGDGVRVAVICNWGDSCGIASYTRYLLRELRAQVDDLAVFSEVPRGDLDPEAGSDPGTITYCWRRGESLAQLASAVLAWKPTVVLIQHEFGLFPKASYWLQLLSLLGDLPTVVTVHSVYEHLDKVVCTGAIKSMIVHTESGAACMRRLGSLAQIHVIPHGCLPCSDPDEHWNIYQTPYTILQFGFGFAYKGVNVALDALHRLRTEQPVKYREIFFTYLCSENSHLRAVNGAYYQQLRTQVDSLGLHDNVAIIRGYQSEISLYQYLRTNKLAIFPYQSDPQNVVYGASGAVRLALANARPTIVSASPMFDDLAGVLPRPGHAGDLAAAIDQVFSDEIYRQQLITQGLHYIEQHSWAQTARHYRLALEAAIAQLKAEALVY